MLSSPTINSNDNKFNFCCARDSCDASVPAAEAAAEAAVGLVEASATRLN